MQVAFSRSECFPYGKAYSMSLSLSNPVNGAEADLESVVDTGFDGSLMVTAELYRRLGLELRERPEELYPVYRTFSGTSVFRRSYGVARLVGKDMEVEVIAPLHGGGKNLLGRRVLNGFTTVLHRAEAACIGDAQVEGTPGAKQERPAGLGLR